MHEAAAARCCTEEEAFPGVDHAQAAKIREHFGAVDIPHAAVAPNLRAKCVIQGVCHIESLRRHCTLPASSIAMSSTGRQLRGVLNKRE